MPTICLASDYLERSFFFDMWLKATVFSRSFTGMKIMGRYHSKTHRPKNRTGSATVTTDLSARTTLLQWHKTEHIIQLIPSIYFTLWKKHLSHTLCNSETHKSFNNSHFETLCTTDAGLRECSSEVFTVSTVFYWVNTFFLFMIE